MRNFSRWRRVVKTVEPYQRLRFAEACCHFAPPIQQYSSAKAMQQQQQHNVTENEGLQQQRKLMTSAAATAATFVPSKQHCKGLLAIDENVLTQNPVLHIMRQVV